MYLMMVMRWEISQTYGLTKDLNDFRHINHLKLYMLPIMELEALNSQKQPIHLLTYLLHSVSKLLNCKKLGLLFQVLELLHYLQFHQYQSFLVKFLSVFMGFRIISLAESSTNLKKENHLYNLFNLFKCLLVSSSFISFVILIIVDSCS